MIKDFKKVITSKDFIYGYIASKAIDLLVDVVGFLIDLIR